MRRLHFLSFLMVSLGSVGQAYAVDPTGIPECDAFLSQYESCGLEVLAGGAKLNFEKGILESAMSFRASAGNEQSRAAIVKLCTDTLNSLKTTETPFKICMNR